MPDTPTREAGMVSAELTVALPAVLVVLLLAVGAVRAGIDEIRCVDAARAAARALARGDAPDTARAAAIRAGPNGARVDLGGAGSMVRVDVTAVRDLAGMRVLTVRGSASAEREELP